MCGIPRSGARTPPRREIGPPVIAAAGDILKRASVVCNRLAPVEDLVARADEQEIPLRPRYPRDRQCRELCDMRRRELVHFAGVRVALGSLETAEILVRPDRRIDHRGARAVFLREEGRVEPAERAADQREIVSRRRFALDPRADVANRKRRAVVQLRQMKAWRGVESRHRASEDLPLDRLRSGIEPVQVDDRRHRLRATRCARRDAAGACRGCRRSRRCSSRPRDRRRALP